MTPTPPFFLIVGFLTPLDRSLPFNSRNVQKEKVRKPKRSLELKSNVGERGPEISKVIAAAILLRAFIVRLLLSTGVPPPPPPKP